MEYSDRDHIKLLLNFAESGGLSMVKKIIEEKNIDASATDKFGCSALHRAAFSGHIKVVLYLLSKGVNVDSRIDCDNSKLSGITPLAYAVLGGRCRVAGTLIERGADTSVVVNGLNLLDIAVDSNDPQTIGLVLRKGFSIEQCFGSSLSPLTRALSKGKRESVKFLLEMGANYRISSSQDNRSPLYYAVQESGECTELLLKHVESEEGKERMLEYVNSDHHPMGRTALHLACYMCKYETVKVLLQCGANPRVKDAQGFLPCDLISTMISNQITDQVRSLLEQSDKAYSEH